MDHLGHLRREVVIRLGARARTRIQLSCIEYYSPAVHDLQQMSDERPHARLLTGEGHYSRDLSRFLCEKHASARFSLTSRTSGGILEPPISRHGPRYGVPDCDALRKDAGQFNGNVPAPPPPELPGASRTPLLTWPVVIDGGRGSQTPIVNHGWNSGP